VLEEKLDTFANSSFKRQKLSQQIISEVRNAIISGKIEPGDRLPTEQELLRNFGVSRLTIREALCGLETIGLLKVNPGLGGGAVVTDVGVETARDGLVNFIFDKNFTIQHLTDVRLNFEPTAARKAANAMSAEKKQELRDILNDCRKKIRAKDEPASLRRLEIYFHTAIIKSTSNPILILLHEFVEYLLWDVKTKLKTDSVFSKSVLKAHEKILAALLQEDADAAEECMRVDILQVHKSLMKIVDSQTVKLRI
jgi:GntR family transcriptional repressor for pyruvate dehydrogenase complex